jgi:hypothetical protein
MKEEWRKIAGFENYEVSNFGLVRSIKRFTGKGGNYINDKLVYLKPSDDGSGYLQVILYNNKKPKSFKVHKIVANSFIPNIHNKPTVNHINGIKYDNSVQNLEWATRSENTKHKYIIGIDNNKGENHPSNKLTELQVLEIRERFNSGETDRCKLSIEYGVSSGHIFSIVKRISWNHI